MSEACVQKGTGTIALPSRSPLWLDKSCQWRSASARGNLLPPRGGADTMTQAAAKTKAKEDFKEHRGILVPSESCRQCVCVCVLSKDDCKSQTSLSVKSQEVSRRILGWRQTYGRGRKASQYRWSMADWSGGRRGSLRLSANKQPGGHRERRLTGATWACGSIIIKETQSLKSAGRPLLSSSVTSGGPR